MKRTYCLIYLFIYFFISCLQDIQAQYKTSSPAKMKALETGFTLAPDSIQTSVYWYWISDNISNEGVIKDLESMKKVGITRAFIGNIGLEHVSYGKVKFLSEEWWDCMHTALKTATRLGIEIGIFNSPGWSQSGGPWVKPQQAMRYLTSSETFVKGPLPVRKKLIKPNSDFQDVRVIAYPALPDYQSDIRALKPLLSTDLIINNVSAFMDKKLESVIQLEKNSPFKLDISTALPFTARSLVIYPAKSPTFLEGDIQVKIKGIYQTIKHFEIERTNTSLQSGFMPYGPAAISIPTVTVNEFRIVFTKNTVNSGIAEIKFSAAPVVEKYIEKTLAKMWHDPYPYWSAYQWPLQSVIAEDNQSVIDPKKVLDISQFMTADGTLTWKVPPGAWIIERCGMTPTQVTNAPATPEGTGLETDKMSKKHINAHFDAFLGEIIRRIPADDRKTWKVTVEDSYETGGQNWSDDLLEKFKLSFGYSPLPYLPVLQGKVVGSADQSDRFLWDLRRFIADNLAYEYVAGLREISHKHGLTTWLENYGHGGFPGEFLQYGGQSDEVAGEFWSEGALGAIENRAAASCAHTYGKTKVSAESFTCVEGNFTRYPALMKQRADRFFAEGINSTLLHVYIHQPNDEFPGINTWFGNEFNRLNTWYYDMDIFLKYIKRCNLLLQQGKYVADVAYFISEDAPKMTGVQDPGLPAGYSFDYINAEVIKNRVKVRNGKLVLPDGMTYSILVLPKLQTMRPELLVKLKELVERGAVVSGPRPSRSPSLQNYGTADKQIQEIATQLWGNINGSSVKLHKLGMGMVIDGMSLEEVFSMTKIKPDCQTNPADSVLFIHRKLDDSSIYFLSNQQGKTVDISPTFRIAGKSPELWDPITGRTRDLPDYNISDSTTTIPLKLEAYESAFIVFRKNTDVQIAELNNNKTNYPKLVKNIPIKGDWLVNFDPKMWGPAKPVVFRQLQDWVLNGSDSIKYYSGAAYYHNNFEFTKVNKNETIILDLGVITAIAKVKVNGIDIGGAWVPPYKLDITSALKTGKNILEIKVVNTWVNRLIGDSRLPEKDRKIPKKFNIYHPDNKLRPAGLIGPVRLEVLQ